MNRSNTRRESPWASWSLSILLHLAIVGIVAGVWFWTQRHRPPRPLSIEGSVVTAQQLAERAQPAPEPVAEDPSPVAEVVPEPEPPAEEPPPPEPDPAQLQAEAEAAAEAERLEQQRLVAQRAEEEARVEAERVRREREQEQRQRAERERAERERVERERVERERVERERVERERQARERTERERREREEAERTRREQDLAAQLAAEQQRAAVRNSAQARQYMDLIRSRVERAWARPPSARVGLACEVRVTQIPGGTVTGVSLGRCNGDDSVRQSIEDAVRRASPLPQPPDPALFERELIFNFAPEN